MQKYSADGKALIVKWNTGWEWWLPFYYWEKVEEEQMLFDFMYD